MKKLFHFMHLEIWTKVPTMSQCFYQALFPTVVDPVKENDDLGSRLRRWRAPNQLEACVNGMGIRVGREL